MSDDAKRFFFVRSLIHISQIANVSTEKILNPSRLYQFAVWWLHTVSNGVFSEKDLTLAFPDSQRLPEKEDIRRIRIVIKSVETSMAEPENNRHAFFWELFTELLLHSDQGAQAFEPKPPEPVINRKAIGRKRQKPRKTPAPDGSGVHAF
jgi:hypothetical protein